MDKVTLEGKVYEKSAVVAKRYGYTADYLGQLSRSEKVDAQLVGRSWYVHAPSVEAYQAGLDEDIAPSEEPNSTSSQKLKPAADKAKRGTVEVETDNRSYSVKTHAGTDEKSFVSKVSRIDEQNTATKNNSHQDSSKTQPEYEVRYRNRSSAPPATQRPARSRFSTTALAKETSHWQKVSYEQDDGALVPNVNQPCDVPPVYELGKKVRVHSNTDKFSIVASAMPEIPLRGEVSVQGVDETNNEDLSLHYKEAGTRVRHQLSELGARQSPVDTRTSNRMSPEVSGATEPAVPARQDNSKRSAANSMVVRLAWTCTGILFTVALAGVLLAGETAYGEASASTLGLTFAPGDWLYSLWPF